MRRDRHERIAVVELFGRYSGETSLITAYLAGVDRAVISEVPFDATGWPQLLVADKRSNPSHYAMVTISEGATVAGGELVLSGDDDAYGHRKLGGIGQLLGEAAPERTGEEIIYQQLALPDALREPRLTRPDGGDELRRHGGRPGARAGHGAHGLAAQRDATPRCPSRRPEKASSASTSDELYDTLEYRPKVRHVLGKPMFLY